MLAKGFSQDLPETRKVASAYTIDGQWIEESQVLKLSEATRFSDFLQFLWPRTHLLRAVFWRPLFVTKTKHIFRHSPQKRLFLSYWTSPLDVNGVSKSAKIKPLTNLALEKGFSHLGWRHFPLTPCTSGGDNGVNGDVQCRQASTKGCPNNADESAAGSADILRWRAIRTWFFFQFRHEPLIIFVEFFRISCVRILDLKLIQHLICTTYITPLVRPPPPLFPRRKWKFLDR